MEGRTLLLTRSPPWANVYFELKYEKRKLESARGRQLQRIHHNTGRIRVVCEIVKSTGGSR